MYKSCCFHQRFFKYLKKKYSIWWVLLCTAIIPNVHSSCKKVKTNEIWLYSLSLFVHIIKQVTITQYAIYSSAYAFQIAIDVIVFVLKRTVDKTNCHKMFQLHKVLYILCLPRSDIFSTRANHCTNIYGISKDQRLFLKWQVETKLVKCVFVCLLTARYIGQNHTIQIWHCLQSNDTYARWYVCLCNNHLMMTSSKFVLFLYRGILSRNFAYIHRQLYIKQ